jgi:DNA-binding GntR family transcriptional regulator
VAQQTPPKYRQIADDLRARIENGDYPPGSMLPSKSALMTRYHVALNTIDRAVEVLRKEGFAEPIQGVGTFARTPPPDSGHSPEYAELMRQIAAVSEEVRQLAERVERLETREVGTAAGTARGAQS